MLTATNPDQQVILRRFLSNWRNPINHLPQLVSVDMAWTILLNELGFTRKPNDLATFRYYRNLYSQQILTLYRRKSFESIAV